VTRPATERTAKASPSRQAAHPPQARRGQLIVASVLLALWLVFLAVMALTA
jgi:hypothetical protein